jgi:hypothetical protein
MTRDHWFLGKRFLSALVIAVIIIAALTGCAPSTTPPTTPPPEEPPPSEPSGPVTPQTILSFKGGEVYVMRAGTDEWIPVEVGMTLQPGDYIKTANGSNAEVTFFEGSTIELHGGTQISLADISLSETGSTTISITQYCGETVSRVQSLTDAESGYEVETEAATAVVRGSTMIVTVYEDGTTTVTNVEGTIWVSAHGNTVNIPEGMTSTVPPDGTPSEPEPPEPPDGGEPPYTPPKHYASVTTEIIVFCDEWEPCVPQQGIEWPALFPIVYGYTITNTGDISMTSVELTNNLPGTPELFDSDLNYNSVLEPGETWLYMSLYMPTCGDLSPPLLVNTATWVVTTYHGAVVTLQDEVEIWIFDLGDCS